MMTIEEFILKLAAFLAGDIHKSYEFDDDPDMEEAYRGDVYITSTEDIEEDACALFILPNGRCNWDNIDALKELSNGKYYITPGETDSFGWLSGCINTPKGIIVYG